MKEKIKEVNVGKGEKYNLTKWNDTWTYIKTVVDILREPILILEKNFTIVAVNEFYLQTFKGEQSKIEGKNLYDLGDSGDGQWSSKELKKLLTDIIPKHTFFKGFEVAQEFPDIGKKIMILNGRQIHLGKDKESDEGGDIILLAMEDVTDMMQVAQMLAEHANNIKVKMKVQVGKVQAELNAMK